MKNTLFLFVCLCFLPPLLYCQEWVRIFTGSPSALSASVIEHYDKGYIIGGRLEKQYAYPNFGYIIKTDVNGNKLWDKRIGDGISRGVISDIANTPDRGLIVCGSTTLIDTIGYEADPYIMKLNACGEKEWCHIYNTPGSMDYPIKILSLKDGYLMLLRYFGYDHTNKRIWLFRYNSLGDLLWQNCYAQEDTLVVGEESFDLAYAKDSSYLISGFCYYPYPGSLWPRKLHPYLICVDTFGNQVWDTPLGVQDSVLGINWSSVFSKKGDIYSSGQNYTDNLKPMLCKTSANGDYLWHKDILTNTQGGGGVIIRWLQDSTLAIGGEWLLNECDSIYEGIWQLDTTGSLIKEKVLLRFHEDSGCYFEDVEITSDHKLLLTASIAQAANWKIYLWKLNQQLEYDSIYTQPFTYDSLCNHAIVSDTIALDCDIVVDINEPFTQPEKSQLKVYPNPAIISFTIELPQYIVSNSKHGSISTSHVLYQWRQGAMLMLYDMGGSCLLQMPVPKEGNLIEINASVYPPGMYLVRLVRNGETIGKCKVVKQL